MPEQWVNLPKKDAFATDGITLERLGPAHVEVEFEKAKLASLKVKVDLKGGSKKASYKKKEERRNKNFKLRKVGASNNGSQKKVNLTKDIFLTAAGGNEWEVNAKYKNKEVKPSETLETRRKLYYQVMHMEHVAAEDTSDMESTYWNEEKNFYIKMKKEGAVEEIDLQQCLRDDDAFVYSCQNKWALKDLKPYGFALAFVRYIASPAERWYTLDVTADVGGVISFELPTGVYLWHDLVPAHDASQAWLVSAGLEFTPTVGTGSSTPIPRSDIRVGGSMDFAYGGRKFIEIDTSPSASQSWLTGSGTWTLTIGLYVVDGFSNGFAYNNVAVLAIADRCWWDDQDPDVMDYTIVHEVGHMVGMVADGTGRAPMAPPNLYGDQPGINDRDHQGPHCGVGASWDDDAEEWSGTPGCVMFGANGTGDGSAPALYCSDCEKIVRKLDLAEEALRTGSFKQTPDEFSGF